MEANKLGTTEVLREICVDANGDEQYRYNRRIVVLVWVVAVIIVVLVILVVVLVVVAVVREVR